MAAGFILEEYYIKGIQIYYWKHVAAWPQIKSRSFKKDGMPHNEHIIQSES